VLDVLLDEVQRVIVRIGICLLALRFIVNQAVEKGGGWVKESFGEFPVKFVRIFFAELFLRESEEVEEGLPYTWVLDDC